MSKRIPHALSAVLFFSLLASLPVAAADLASCKKSCGATYGQCIQANPDPDVFEKVCTPKRNQCLTDCEPQATAKPFAPRKLSAPSKTTRMFWEAFDRKNYEMMDLLLQQGADINCENCHDSGLTPLMQSAEGTWGPQGFRMVDYLVGKGANVNYQNNTGNSALMAFARKIGSADRNNASASETISLLMSKGADVRLRDRDGNTALHYLAESGTGYSGAAYKFWLRALNDFIAAGADVNAKSRKGITPLMLLAKQCDPNPMRDLLGLGADAGIKSLAGDTALNLAMEKASSSSNKSCNEVVGVLSSTSSATRLSAPALVSTDTAQTGTNSLMDSLKKLDESLKTLNQ